MWSPCTMLGPCEAWLCGAKRASAGGPDERRPERTEWEQLTRAHISQPSHVQLISSVSVSLRRLVSNKRSGALQPPHTSAPAQPPAPHAPSTLPKTHKMGAGQSQILEEMEKTSNCKPPSPALDVGQRVTGS